MASPSTLSNRHVILAAPVKKRLSQRLVPLRQIKHSRSDDTIGTPDRCCEVDPDALNEQLAQQAKALASANDRADQLKDDLLRFVSAASHDLRTPLRAVAGFSKLLEQDCYEQLCEDGKDYLNRIVAGTDRMQRLINAITEYSRISALVPQPTEVDLNDVFENAVSDLQAKIIEANAVVIKRNLPVVVADNTQLSQILRHLIENSISFGGTDSPKVTVSTVREEDRWLVQVKDNGRGIPADQIESAFEMFRRIDYVEKDQGNLGAGLAICKRIIQRQGEEINIQSELGVGTTVTFSIADIDDCN